MSPGWRTSRVAGIGAIQKSAARPEPTSDTTRPARAPASAAITITEAQKRTARGRIAAAMP